MAHILTIQSHVVYGYAGNAAAVFPMQRLGHEVSTLNLLQFSNHTGHGTCGGGVIDVEELKRIFEGLKHLEVLTALDGIISGYIGSLEQAQAIYEFVLEAKVTNPRIIYCCDPVMGDERPGMYVKPEIAAFIRSHLVPLADWITPNRFEVSQLVGRPIHGLKEITLACEELFDRQKQGILATSVAHRSDMTGLLLLTKTGAYHCEAPRYELARTVHGTGDATTAIFLSHLLQGDEVVKAMEKTANILHDITLFTYENHLKELGLIQCQDVIAHPREIYQARECV